MLASRSTHVLRDMDRELPSATVHRVFAKTPARNHAATSRALMKENAATQLVTRTGKGKRVMIFQNSPVKSEMTGRAIWRNLVCAMSY